MAKRNHTHKYYRTTLTPERGRHGKISGKKIWRCGLPGCTHYVYHKNLVLNRQSICWVCGEAFILTNAALRNARPHCNCKVVKDETVNDVLGILAQLDIPVGLKNETLSSPVHEMPENVERDFDVKELAQGISESREAFNKLQDLLAKAERSVRLDPI